MRPAGSVRHSVGLIDSLAQLAKLRLADPAVETNGAWRNPGEDDFVANGEPSDALADLLHRARPLVAKNTRQLSAQNSMHEREVGMANSGCREAHPNLIAARGIEQYLLNPYRLISFVANGCFHRLLASFAKQAWHGEILIKPSAAAGNATFQIWTLTALLTPFALYADSKQRRRDQGESHERECATSQLESALDDHKRRKRHEEIHP